MEEKREKLADKYQELIGEVEASLGKELSPLLFEEIKPLLSYIDNLNDEEKIRIAVESIDGINNFVEASLREGGLLQERCKKNIIRIVEVAYADSQGVKFNLWKYMNFTFFMIKVVEDFQKMKDKNLSKETRMYILLKLYSDCYELTLKFLLEFALIIARKKQNKIGECGRKLLRKYAKRTDILKRDIIEFLKEEKLWKNCRVIDNSFWRNKPSHAEAYYNSIEDKFVFGNQNVEMGELEKRFREILSFNAELINQIFIKTEIYNFLEKSKAAMIDILKKNYGIEI